MISSSISASNKLENTIKPPASKPLSRLQYFGPALIAAIAYVDPGNFATNIEAGSRYGYTLLWVVLAANIMAMFIQTLSARLGLITGKNLAEIIRDKFPKPIVWGYWIQAELVAIATDLAEFLGAALAFKLLFGLPMIIGALLTGVITYAALLMQRFGLRLMEIIISAILMAIACGFLLELVLSQPQAAPFFHGLLVPKLPDNYAVYLSAGIIGATVMPHVIYLHSALLQHRYSKDELTQRRQIRGFRWDVIIGMTIAGFVNLAILALAASTFHSSGNSQIASISESYRLLSPLLGTHAAGLVFGLTLLLAGLSSSIVGTLSGQILMQGFVGFQIPLWLRRLITMLPAIAIIIWGVSEQKALVASQVILSLGIPFALFPLILFTASKTVMGKYSNAKWLTYLVSAMCCFIIFMNIYVIFYTFWG